MKYEKKIILQLDFTNSNCVEFLIVLIWAKLLEGKE